MFQYHDRYKPYWFVSYTKHCLLAVLVPLFVGGYLDLPIYRAGMSHVLGDIGLAAMAIAALLGFLMNRKRLERVALLVWIPALLLFGTEVYQLIDDWSPQRTSSSLFEFVVDNALGIKPGCEAECIGGLWASSLANSLAYSAGACLARRRAKALHEWKSEGQASYQ